MQARRHSVKWWGLVVHPWLPLADLLDTFPSRRAKKVAAVLFAAHDNTFPEGAG
jgi:hypothetical protein